MSEIDTVFDLPDRRAIRPLLSAAFAAFYATALASIALYGRNAWRQYSRDHRTERISHESLQI